MGREYFDALCDRENGKFYEDNQLIYGTLGDEQQYPENCHLWPGAFYQEIMKGGTIYRVAYKKQLDGKFDFLGYCHQSKDWDLFDSDMYWGTIYCDAIHIRYFKEDITCPEYLKKQVGFYGIDRETAEKIIGDLDKEVKRQKAEEKKEAIREWQHDPDEMIKEVRWTIENDLPEDGFEMEENLRDAIRRGFGGSLAAITDLKMTSELSDIVDAGEFIYYKMRVVAEMPGVDPYPELLVEYHYDLDGTITLDEIYG